jgi:phage N-6-adenine-methyltransferase
MSWRDVLKIHPACELFPPLPPDELKALGDDIKAHRLQNRVKLWAEKTPDGVRYSVLDGRSRLDAIEVAGLPIQVFINSRPNRTFFEVVEEYVDPFDYVVSANMKRRHLTSEERDRIIGDLIKLNPTKSNRQIAKQTSVSPTTVGKVRDELERAGDVSTTGHVDTKGRVQPGHKPKPSAPPPDAERSAVERKQHYAADDAAPVPAPPAPRKPTTDEWYTPPKYIEAAREVLGHIGLDPATSLVAQETVKADNFYTVEIDGLTHGWRGHVWLNPPYSLMPQFVEKLLSEYSAGNVNAAILLSSNGTDTAWFHHAASAATTICFTRGRIKFIDGNGPSSERSAPPSGSTFLFFGVDALRFHAVFAKFGTVMMPWHAGTAVAAEAAE